MADEAIVERARSLVGAPFRAQGRDRMTGLDCVGLVAAAAGIAPNYVPADYRLRGGGSARLHCGLERFGFRRLPDGQAQAGDVVLLRSGPEQMHLVVLTPAGFVQAHAGLRRVVETPGAPPWPRISAWRYSVGTRSWRH